MVKFVELSKEDLDKIREQVGFWGFADASWIINDHEVCVTRVYEDPKSEHHWKSLETRLEEINAI